MLLISDLEGSPKGEQSVPMQYDPFLEEKFSRARNARNQYYCFAGQ